ncbi:MAG TPA: hypothetical protein VFV67_28550 [Actinophytocola sp.]|uniref:hypothetical protein n=1 Tax=Actinophytocola sp. TaxID=1872138 RepID=UPI002DBAF242|nr:hypothetical protein [Actinophytocola sp.]HEU5474616.1 hypothetical protein [Actinophytocola sp.]
MSELARLDIRVTNLEREMPEVRKLAADASNEVGDVHARLRAHTKSLNALRTTQVEQGVLLREQGVLLNEQGVLLNEQGVLLNEQGVLLRENGQELSDLRTEMREGFAKLNVGMAQMTALITLALRKLENGE